MKSFASRGDRGIVLLNGVDVSMDCAEADDEEGYVMLVEKDATGRLLSDGLGNPVLKRHEGKVEIALRGN